LKTKKHIIRFVSEILAIGVVIGLDQWFKVIAEKTLQVNGPKTVIPKVLEFVYCRNTGAAFSIFSSNTTVLSVITLIAIVGVLVYLALPKNRPVAYDICASAIVAGGAGNLIDRFSKGYVVDYINPLFVKFAVFNFADCFITCGCFALVIYLIYESVRDVKKKQAGNETASSEEIREDNND